MEQTVEKLYYQEIDKDKRKAVLDGAIAKEGINPEYELRQALWERRYVRREKDPEGVDYYIRGWMSLMYLKQSATSMLGKRSALRDIQKAKKDWNLEFLREQGELGERLLYQELYNMVKLYIHLCGNDKNYRSSLFGLMQIDQKKLTEKIAYDVYESTWTIPEILGVEEEFQVLQRAAADAFCDVFPGEEHLIRR